MTELLNSISRTAKAWLAALFAAIATWLVNNQDQIVEDVSAWVSAAVVTVIAWVVTYLVPNKDPDA